MLGSRAKPGEELRLGDGTRAVLVAEPDVQRLSVEVEVCFPPELAARITGTTMGKPVGDVPDPADDVEGEALDLAAGGDPTPFDLNDPEGRVAAFKAEVEAGDWDRAHQIARMPLPPTWPEDVRRSLGGWRDLARVAAGRDPQIGGK